jgi:predicted phosphodiesterase
MRFMIFSDIHGNLDALERVIEEIDMLRPDMIVCLGDVVGYGANPRECIDIVEEFAQIRIGGNHDLATVGLTDSSDFNLAAKRSIAWTERTLDPTHHEMLERYDSIKRYSGCIFTHATPLSPLSWEYIYTVSQARKIFRGVREKFIFIGHTHVPGIIAYGHNNACTVVRDSIVTIKPESRYLINVGSVGQPRDGITAASFALLDTKKQKISLRRVPYDVTSAQEKIRSVGLPEVLASRLATAT